MASGTVGIRRAAWAALGLAVLAGPAQGQNFLWNRSGDGNWSAGANWAGGVAPPGGGSGTVGLAFTNPAPPNPSAVSTNDLGSPFTLNRLAFATRYGFNDSAATVIGLEVTGGALRLAADGPTNPSVTQTGAAVAVSSPLELAANTAVAGAGHGHLTLSGGVSGTGSLTLARTSAGGLTVLGNGNTFTGGVTLQGGVLALQGPATGTGPTATTALGAGPLTVNGGSLRFNNFPTNSTGLAVNNPVTANADLVFAGNNSGFLNGVVGGTGGVVNAGAVGITLRLTAANTYAGRTEAGSTPTLGGNTVTFIDNGSALSTTAVHVRPLGTLVLDNAGSANLADRLPDAVPVTLSRGTLTFNGSAAADSSETVGPLVASGSVFVGVAAGAGRAATLTVNGTTPLARNDAAVLYFRGTNLGANAPGTADTASVVFANPAAVTAALVGGTGLPGDVTATTVPVLPFAVGHTAATGNPTTLVTYDPATGVRALAATQFAPTAAEGTVTATNVRLTAPLALNQPTTVNALVVASTTSPSSTGGTTGAGPLTVASGAVLVNTTTAASIANLAFTGEGVVTAFGTGLTVGTLTGSAAGLVKNGTASLTPANALAVPGPLTVQAGAVVIDGEAKLGTVTQTNLNGGRLNYTGTGETTARTFRLGAAGGGFEVANALTVSSPLADMPGQPGALVKSGAGTLTLAGANTYTGDTVVTGGTLAVSAAEHLGAGGRVVLNSAATLSAAGSFATNKTVLLTGGAGAATLTTAAGATLTLDGPIDHVGSAVNAFGLTKAGPGTLVVNGSGSFNGVLTVAGGTVRVNGTLAPVNSGNAGTFVGVSLGNGATLAGTGVVERDVDVNAGATVTAGAAGPGRLTLNGADFDGGGTYVWKLKDAAGAAGVGYDQLALNGPLDVLATAGTPFTVRVVGLDGANNPGAVANFDPNTPRTWAIATFPSVTGFDPTKFTLDASQFVANNPLGGGTLSLALSGNTLNVVFTPVPEPGYVLLLGAAGWLYGRRKG